MINIENELDNTNFDEVKKSVRKKRTTSSSPKFFSRIPGWAYVLLLSVAAWVCWWLISSQYTFLSSEYLFAERSISDLSSFCFSYGYLPVYPLLLWALASIFGASNYLLVTVIIQGTLFIVSTYFFYKTCERFSPSKLLLVLVSLTYGMAPVFFDWSICICSEAIAIPLLVIFVSCFLSFNETHKPSFGVGTVVLSLILTFTQQVFFVLPVFLLIYIIVLLAVPKLRGKTNVSRAPFSAMLIGVIIVIAAAYFYASNSSAVTGRFALSNENVAHHMIICVESGSYKSSGDQEFIDLVDEMLDANDGDASEGVWDILNYYGFRGSEQLCRQSFTRGFRSYASYLSSIVQDLSSRKITSYISESEYPIISTESTAGQIIERGKTCLEVIIGTVSFGVCCFLAVFELLVCIFVSIRKKRPSWEHIFLFFVFAALLYNALCNSWSSQLKLAALMLPLVYITLSNYLCRFAHLASIAFYDSMLNAPIDLRIKETNYSESAEAKNTATIAAAESGRVYSPALGKAVSRIPRAVLACLCFFIIFAVLFTSVSYIFRPNNLFAYYSEEEDTIDMVYIGASAAYTYWAPMEAWNDYGIASYVFASSSLPADAVKFMVKEALKTQSPELIVIDAREFISREDQIPEVSLRYCTDKAKFSADRLKLIIDTYPVIEGESGLLDLVFDLSMYHSRWNEVTTWNLSYLSDDYPSPYRGCEIFTEYRSIELQELSDVTGSTALNSDAESLLYDLIDYLNTLEGIDILFVISPFREEEYVMEYDNYLEEIVVSAGFDFINFNKLYDEIGLDGSTDFGDGAHVNIFGMEKYTAYFAGYINTTYDLPDRRQDKNYASWNDDYYSWRTYFESAMEDTLAFVQGTDSVE